MQQKSSVNSVRKNADDLALVAYCGLYCGDCFWHTGKVQRLAAALSAEICSSGYDGYVRYITRFPAGRKLKHFDRFQEVLAAMQVPGCTQDLPRWRMRPEVRIPPVLPRTRL
jgi:hypothetical protein